MFPIFLEIPQNYTVLLFQILLTQQFSRFVQFQQQVDSLGYSGGGGSVVFQPLSEQGLQLADNGGTVLLNAMEGGHVLVLLQHSVCFGVSPGDDNNKNKEQQKQ